MRLVNYCQQIWSCIERQHRRAQRRSAHHPIFRSSSRSAHIEHLRRTTGLSAQQASGRPAAKVRFRLEILGAWVRVTWQSEPIGHRRSDPLRPRFATF